MELKKRVKIQMIDEVHEWLDIKDVKILKNGAIVVIDKDGNRVIYPDPQKIIYVSIVEESEVVEKKVNKEA